MRLNPTSLEVANRLGQRLHHLAERSDDIERFRRAEELLARVTFLDDRAKLLHGWSALHVAQEDGDAQGEERALAEIDEALKRRAFGQRSGDERQRWLRQVRRLHGAGFDDRATAAAAFANENARWRPIDLPDDIIGDAADERAGS